MKALKTFIMEQKKFLLVYTIINVLICVTFSFAFLTFCIRQGLFFFLLFLYHRYSFVFKEYQKESQFIQSNLRATSPILFLQPVIGLLTYLSLYILLLYSADPSYFNFFIIILNLWFIYVMMLIHSFGLIYKNPELSRFYNIKLAIKIDGARSVSTAKTILHNFSALGRIVGGVLLMGEMGPRAVYGDLDARGIPSNVASYFVCGLTARTNTQMREATNLLDLYPASKPLIVDESGYSINPLKLKCELEQKGLKVDPFLKFETTHHLKVEGGTSHDFQANLGLGKKKD